MSIGQAIFNPYEDIVAENMRVQVIPNFNYASDCYHEFYANDIGLVVQ